MEYGNVKWFSADKMYGFIEPEEGRREDVFVHISALEKSGIRPEQLKGANKEKGIKGERVSYDLKEEVDRSGKSKKSAINIKLVPADAG